MIRNSEDVNKYYKLVNEYIDDYIDKWNIKPTNLKKYLLGHKSRMISFLEKRGINNVKNIEQVIKDVIDDRVSIYNDNVMTFENFNYINSNEFEIANIGECLYKGIDTPTISHEKLLADEFNVSLSHINLESPNKHLFEVDTEKEILKVIIYDKTEFENIKLNLREFFINKIFNKKLDLEIAELSFSINIDTIVDISKLDNYIDTLLSDDKIIGIVEKVSSSEIININTDCFIFKIK